MSDPECCLSVYKFRKTRKYKDRLHNKAELLCFKIKQNKYPCGYLLRQVGIGEHEIFNAAELISYETHIQMFKLWKRFGKYIDEDGNVNLIENCCGWMQVTNQRATNGNFAMLAQG